MLVLNHKMFLTKEEINKYIIEIKDRIPQDINVVVCPSNIYLPYFDGRYDFKLGVQNLFYKDMGAVTGEVCAKQLKSLGVSYAIIGHSERKELFNETTSDINLKIKSALNFGINPIVCVGETKEERLLRKTDIVLLKQIKECFKEVVIDSAITIAYEPIWAIGKNAASVKEIAETIDTIKEIVLKLYNVNIKVLYGGSVNETNIEQIFNLQCVDGVLVGSASTDYKKVQQIFKVI